MRLGRLAASSLVAALLATGCGISNPSNAKTEPFSGTLQVGGRDIYTFRVDANGGEVNIKITQLSPDSGATLGLAYGQPGTGTDCIAIQQTALGTLNRTALSNTIEKGSYCLVVFDSGFLQRAESYTVTVSHP